MTKVTPLTMEDSGGQKTRRSHPREIPDDSDKPLETVGQALRGARQRRSDDLITVSNALKIRKDHLEALEEDRIENLPGRTYAVGFVRTYADYLGLDAARVVERFKTQIAGRTDDDIPTITVIDEDEHLRLPQGWKIIAGVVLLLFAYGAYHLLTPVADKAISPPVAPVPAQYTPKPVVEKKTPAKPIAVPVKPVPAPVQQVAVPPPAATNPAAPATANSVPPAPAQAAPVPPPATQEAATPQGAVYGQKNRNARIILRVKATTQVAVEGANGTSYLDRVLNAGDSYMVPDKTGLSLSAADGGAIEIDLDGASTGMAGDKGKAAAKLSLDPQAIVDRFSEHPGHQP